MMLAWKWRSFWGLHAPGWDIVRWAYPFTALLALAGVWLARSRWRELAFQYLVGAGFALSALVFYGSDRFRAPLEPPMIVLAALVAVRAVGWFSRARLPGVLPSRARFWRKPSTGS